MIQGDLNLLAEWSDRWQMKFNVDKRKAMHFGDNYKRYDYKLFGNSLTKVNEERYLISNNLKYTKQCRVESKKGNQMLGFKARNIDYKTSETNLTLYDSLVRPHFEYAVQFWSPNYKRDHEKLEQLQRHATKLISSLRNLA
ncbi:uncharacterized protein [Panulirus ornatus]|uniref:uncharacterized protein n=1 Tax=Panulirus ornatus TaxID=150431 RepID=UPI003A8B951B